jgi:hypothetical protein
LYNLADKFKKPNKWIYALLAVVTYIASNFITGFIIGLLLVVSNSDFQFTQGNELMLNLIGIPIGIGAVALLHYLLKRSWSKQNTTEDQILDDSISNL